MPLLLVFEMHPLRDMNTAHEFEYFLGLEHFFILTTQSEDRLIQRKIRAKVRD